MFRSIRQVLTLFSAEDRRRFLVVLFAMFVMGGMQMIGVGAILPFVSLLSDPSAIHEHAVLEFLFVTGGFTSAHTFLVFVGVALLVILVGSNVVTALTLWVVTRFAWSIQRRISERLLAGYLNQPYEQFLNRNSADIGKNILIESQQFTNGILMPLLKSLGFGLTATMIIGFLFWLQPLLAAVVCVVFVSAYFLVYLTVRRALLRIGRRRLAANTTRFQAVNEAFGSVKEVKVMRREPHFLASYNPAAQTYALTMANSQVLALIPRYFIEALAFAVVMGGMLYVLVAGGSVKDALPVASAFVVAGYRLLPALQNIYQGFAQWRFNQSVLDTLLTDLKATRNVSPRPKGQDLSPVEADRLKFQDVIQLKHMSYQYPRSDRPSLANISIEIRRNTFVALTGSTGAGKTTLADIVLGLLEPTSGQVLIDGVPLDATTRSAWQANLGYVPQDIYLTDSSIAGNIAYGLAPDQIDMVAVERAAKIANIHDFIVDKLPEGYRTSVGERGVRLSGGQRQRIGIARALYHDPAVIVLDEATSALDNETERRIVNELDSMRGGRTLIVIAHRLTTVQKCHEVFLLGDGKVVANGTYDELVAGNREFAQLAQTE
ncbi:ABC transporter ATP-binding protein [Salinisphaera japonica]|uniref:ABC transporter n=1 Tax=Salinisphaera japonica YTM-1 TaxID=1209778 RepID=A0A423PL85_9GAMM|nr:ATP-binding cassette domain-containing protein [Salinisphaera japonica]ROO26356.1 ABC transporter [Salinisphaera japonica YTM-1]